MRLLIGAIIYLDKMLMVQIAFNQLIAVDNDQAFISSYLAEFWWWSLWQPDADPGHVYSSCSRLIHGSLKGRGSQVCGGIDAHFCS